MFSIEHLDRQTEREPPLPPKAASKPTGPATLAAQYQEQMLRVGLDIAIPGSGSEPTRKRSGAGAALAKAYQVGMSHLNFGGSKEELIDDGFDESQVRYSTALSRARLAQADLL